MNMFLAGDLNMLTCRDSPNMVTVVLGEHDHTVDTAKDVEFSVKR